jgi:hypothetical protein
MGTDCPKPLIWIQPKQMINKIRVKFIYNLSKAITTPASEAIALDMPMNSVAEIFDLAGGS